MKARPKILIVMAGFYQENYIPAVTQVWVESLAVHAHQLVLVFDNSPDQIPPQWGSMGLMFCLSRMGNMTLGLISAV